MSHKPEQKLAISFAVAVRTAAYYESDNDVMRQTCSALCALFKEQFKEQEMVTIGIHSHCVFVGSVRIRSTVMTYSRYAYLIDLYASWSIGSLTFYAALDEEDLMDLLCVLSREKDRGSSSLASKLEELGVSNVQANLEGGMGTQPATVAPVEVYAACRQMGEDIQTGLDRSETRSMRQLRHVTQAVVDQVLSEPGSLIALTTIKDFDGYLISHSANVAILSVILGQRLGMSKAGLGELCLAAFLHDLGKLEINPDILNKTGKLDENEWDEMRRHPVLAARTLLQELRQNDASMAAVVVAFEHHLRYDLSGYPTPKIRKELSLFSRIVSIADVFDAMTTPRVYRGRNFTPYEALNFIIRSSGSQFDPVLVKLFAEIMGLYPSGTVVRLTTGELGVVCEPPVVGAPLDRPRVRVLSGEEPGRVLDLDERLDGEHLRGVRDVVNPANQGSIPAIELSLLEAMA